MLLFSSMQIEYCSVSTNFIMVKNIFSPALILLTGFTHAITGAHAQSHNNNLHRPPTAIAIDGNLKDWGDSLYYYNEEKKLYYTLANDAQNIYVAIRLNDRSEQERVLMAGLTLGINSKGKKKDNYKVTFPVANAQDMADMMAARRNVTEPTDEQPTDREEMRKVRLTKLRNIKVEGFKDIDYDILTTTNSYGFKAAIDYDADGNLVYEAAIPLKFFDTADVTKNEWAFNFRVNGITRPQGGDQQGGPGSGRGGMGGGGGMGRGGMGGGMAGGGGRGGRGGGMGRNSGAQGGNNGFDRSALSKSEDFWEKFYLAKL